MIDFVIRDTGEWGFLPFIRTLDGSILYHGESHQTAEAALARAKKVWEEDLCQSVKDFKAANR